MTEDINKIIDTFTPSPIRLNEGKALLHGDCRMCGSHKTVYYSEDTEEFFCVICKRNNVKSESMKKIIKNFTEVETEMRQSPDEFEVNAMKERIKNHYVEYQEIKRMIYSLKWRDIIPTIRRCRIYKAHSNALSDEDKLCLTAFIYRDRNEHRINDMSEQEIFKDFKQWIKDNECLSRAKRRRNERMNGDDTRDKTWLFVKPFDPVSKKVTIQIGEYTSRELENYLVGIMENLTDKYGNDITINIETNVKEPERKLDY